MGAAGRGVQVPTGAPVVGVGELVVCSGLVVVVGGRVVTPDAAGCSSPRWPSHQPPPTSPAAISIPINVSAMTRCLCLLMSCPLQDPKGEPRPGRRRWRVRPPPRDQPLLLSPG